MRRMKENEEKKRLKEEQERLEKQKREMAARREQERLERERKMQALQKEEQERKLRQQVGYSLTCSKDCIYFLKWYQ